MSFKLRILCKNSKSWVWTWPAYGESFLKDDCKFQYAISVGYSSKLDSDDKDELTPENVTDLLNKRSDRYQDIEICQFYFSDLERWDENGNLYGPIVMYELRRNPHVQTLGGNDFYMHSKTKIEKYPTNKYSS